MAEQHRTLIQTLGLLGLIPFLLLLTAMSVKAEYQYPLALTFAYYTACILSFLAGSFWRENKASLLIGSNLLTLYAAACLVLFHINALLSISLLALGFLSTLALEFYRQNASWYRKLRIGLSLIVILMHGLFLILW